MACRYCVQNLHKIVLTCQENITYSCKFACKQELKIEMILEFVRVKTNFVSFQIKFSSNSKFLIAHLYECLYYIPLKVSTNNSLSNVALCNPC